MIPIANPELSEDATDRVQAILESGMLADGPEVRSFENEFAEYCGVDHGVATSNGTTALHAALKGMGIEAGHRVLTSPFSFIASANSIRLAGADVGFVDIDPRTYNMDMDVLEARLEAGERVDAVMPVHIFGLPADMPRLMDLADEYGFLVLEDAAQAHGATIDDQSVGSFGDAACFSFYPTKNMTTGEGGMVVTDDAEIAANTASFVNHGRDGSGGYDHQVVGHNFRMTSIAAAIGRSQLERLPAFIDTRRENAARLTEGLDKSAVDPPTVPPERAHAFHQYTVRTTEREALCSHLEENDIGYGIYYPTCIHDQPAYAEVDCSAPVAERAAEEVVSLPVHPALSTSDIATIIEVVTAYA